MEFSLEMKEQFEAINRSCGKEAASFNFITLYLWAGPFQLEIFFEDDYYVIKYNRGGKNSWFFPVGNRNHYIDFLNQHIEEPDFELYSVLEEDKEFLEDTYPDHFSFEHTGDDDEYILSIEEHMELKGKRFETLRSQLNRYRSRYETRMVPIDASNKQIAFDILAKWREQDDSAIFDYDHTEDMVLKMADELGIHNYINYVDGEPVGVIGGYPISDTMYDMTIAKTISKAPGVGYGTKHAFMELVKDQYQYMNMEDDLGLEKLRRLKTHLSPHHMIKYYLARRI